MAPIALICYVINVLSFFPGDVLPRRIPRRDASVLSCSLFIFLLSINWFSSYLVHHLLLVMIMCGSLLDTWCGFQVIFLYFLFISFQVSTLISLCPYDIGVTRCSFYYTSVKNVFKVRYCPGINQTFLCHDGSHASASSLWQKNGPFLGNPRLSSVSARPSGLPRPQPHLMHRWGYTLQSSFLHPAVVSSLHLPSPRKEIPKPTKTIFWSADTFRASGRSSGTPLLPTWFGWRLWGGSCLRCLQTRRGGEGCVGSGRLPFVACDASRPRVASLFGLLIYSFGLLFLWWTG